MGKVVHGRQGCVNTAGWVGNHRHRATKELQGGRQAVCVNMAWDKVEPAGRWQAIGPQGMAK